MNDDLRHFGELTLRAQEVGFGVNTEAIILCGENFDLVTIFEDAKLFERLCVFKSALPQGYK